MIAGDEEKARDNHILMRGEYDKPGEKVAPSAPSSIMPYAADLLKNRLGLAQWIVSPDNPLTARVVVNRLRELRLGREAFASLARDVCDLSAVESAIDDNGRA